MRRLIIVGTALGLMWGLPHLTIVRENGAFHPLTLAAIGFVLLAAFAVGEFGGMLKLPKVTGYIVSGIVLGPFVLNILSRKVAGEMQGFNTLALGLIALTAGLELDVKAMAKVGRTLLATILLKLPLLLLIVGGTFYAVQTYYPILPDLAGSSVIVLALLFSIFAIGTSPAIAIAVVSESKSKGRLSDIVLSIAVAKDLVVVVCLALGISYARVTLNPSASLDVHTLIKVGEELGLSLAAGAVIGGVIFLYTRFVRRELLMMLLVVVIVAAELSRLFHLELLLVLIGAGFVIRNFTNQEHRLIEQLRRVSLPVFVVFFTTAGANVDLAATQVVLPLAAALVFARGVAYALASGIGSRIGRESAAVRRFAWMAYLPQAGVTLGLLLIAAEAIPELAVPIRQVGMTVVAINLLLGPVLMSVSLKKAGEVPSSRRVFDESSADETHVRQIPVSAGHAVAKTVTDTDSDSALSVASVDASSLVAAEHETPEDKKSVDEPASVQSLLPVFSVPDLVLPHVQQVENAIQGAISGFVGDQVRQLQADGRAAVNRLLRGNNLFQICENVSELMSASSPLIATDWEHHIEALLQKQFSAISELPHLLPVSMKWNLLQYSPNDTVGVRLQKFALRRMMVWGMGSVHVREVPLRLIARIALEQRLTQTAVQIAASWYRTELRALDVVQQVIAQQIEREDAQLAVDELFANWTLAAQSDFQMALQSGLTQMYRDIEKVGSPELPVGKLRYSAVAPLVQRAMQQLFSQASEWRDVVRGAYQTVHVSALLRFAEYRLMSLTEKRLVEPVRDLQAQLLPVLREIDTRFKELKTVIDSHGEFDDDALAELLQTANALFPREQRYWLRGMVAGFRRTTRKSAITRETTSILTSFQRKQTIVPPGIRAEFIFEPKDAHLFEIHVAGDVERYVGDVFFKTMITGPLQLGSLLVSAEPSLREAMHVVTYGIEVAMRKGEDSLLIRRELISSAIERAQQRASAFCQEVAAAIEAVDQSGAQLGDALPTRLSELLLPEKAGSDMMHTTAFTESGEKLSRYWQHWQEWIRLRVEKAVEIVSGASKRSAEEWRIQQGEAKLDAAGIRQYCESRIPCQSQLPLPSIYVESHTLEPVSDRRILAARRKLMERVSFALNDRSDLESFILVSDRGAGRTTFVTEMQFRLNDRRVYRFDGGMLERGSSVVQILSDELGCLPDETVLIDRLKTEHAVIIVDDLEKVLSPTLDGVTQLSEWLSLVVKTHGISKWLMTLNSGVWKQLVEVNGTFFRGVANVVSLAPVDWRELREVIEKRQRLVGITCHIGRMFGPLDFLFNWRKGARERQYYRTLEAVSNGNIRRALLSHLHSLRQLKSGTPTEEQGTTMVLLAQQPRRIGLPFLPWLESEAIAVLAHITKMGPMSHRELQSYFSMTSSRLDGLMLFLSQTGLLERHIVGYEEKLRIPAHLSDAVTRELTRLQLFEKELP